jgi:sugar/nucleoside kinase (ribokinase family)
MNFDLIVVGVISLDTILKVPFLPDKNSECFVSEIIETHGGAGGNVAAYASYYGGLNVGMVAGIGNDGIGDELVQRLELYNVNIDGVLRSTDKSSTRIITALLEDGSRSYFVSLGAHLSLADIELPKNYTEAQHIYIAPCSPQIHERFISQAVRNNMNVYFNPGSVYIEQADMSIFNRLLRYTEILFVNKEEALIYSSLSSITEAGKYLVNSGPKLVVITGGMDGSLIYSRGSSSPLVAPSFEVYSVNPVGAGDAFAAGFLSEYFISNDLRLAGTKGSIFGAFSVKQRETRAINPSLNDFQKFLEKVR